MKHIRKLRTSSALKERVNRWISQQLYRKVQVLSSQLTLITLHNAFSDKLAWTLKVSERMKPITGDADVVNNARCIIEHIVEGVELTVNLRDSTCGHCILFRRSTILHNTLNTGRVQGRNFRTHLPIPCNVETMLATLYLVQRERT